MIDALRRRLILPRFWIAAGVLLVLPLPQRTTIEAAEPNTKPLVDFNRDVRPLLAKHCFACHGLDEAHRGGKLRLDLRDAATHELKSGAIAIVPGKAGESEAVSRLNEPDESLRMPPAKEGDRLKPSEIATITRWIDEGATYAEHWSLVAPKQKPLPEVAEKSWPRNGIDFWIADRLQKAGLKPSPEADRFALLRRVSLDLRGLPPTIAEIDEFAADSSPDAYEKAVDRFLDDKAFGERWARLWLDLARYADSAGYGSDPLRTIHRYRDWVIDAFNQNKPFDQFTIEQIAGDLLPNPTLDQKIATAFHRNTMTNTEGGTDDEEFRVAAIKDRVDSTSQIWLGLTIGCAKCHNHKYDPVTQKEYYQLYAFFNQTADADRSDEAPLINAPTASEAEQARKLDEQVAPLKTILDTATPELADDQKSWEAGLADREKGFPTPIAAILKIQEPDRTPAQRDELARHYRTIAPRLQKTRDELAALEKTRPNIATVPVMVELPLDQRRSTRLLQKGNFLTPGEAVEAGLPGIFAGLPQGAKADRLALARWIVDPANPLTARVVVNRYWSQFFGTGLVETEEDFGTQGEPPSHPELLDWLALEYQKLGWNTKAFLRLIVTSSTYRQSSKVTPELLQTDPKNRLLSRGPRFRLEAEMVRDQALAFSGLLSKKMHGPSVFPPQPEGLWQAAFNGQRTWSTSTGEDKHRRGIYTFWRRTVPYPSMATFDAPSREICAVRRIRTNTPLQAFVTLNDPVYVEASQALARRMVAEGGSEIESRVKFGLKLCLGRPPTDDQALPLMELYKTERAHYANDPKAAIELATDPLGPLPPGLDPADLAAMTTIANVLLNLDAVLTKS